MRINYYLNIKDMEKVREIMVIHDRYVREEDFPYQDEQVNLILRSIKYRLKI